MGRELFQHCETDLEHKNTIRYSNTVVIYFNFQPSINLTMVKVTSLIPLLFDVGSA